MQQYFLFWILLLINPIVLVHIININNSILVNGQLVFFCCPKRVWESQLITFIQELFNKEAASVQFEAVILEFSRAFDKVLYIRLINKLDFHGIRNKTHDWVGTILNNREYYLICDGFSWTSANVFLLMFLRVPFLITHYLSSL